jgi:hypothetical protein
MQVDANDLVLVQGLRDTRATLEGWANDRWRVLRTWTLGALAVALFLLFATWVVAQLTTADSSFIGYAGVTRDPSLEDIGFLLYRNSLVLALHAMACVAGFIAGSSLPLTAAGKSGVWRWVHDKAGPLASAFVVGATLFSLSTQAYALGLLADQLAYRLDISVATLIVGLLPHAIPELVALFLPLAAWTIASRHDRWHELLAATFVTVAIAAPVLVAAAFIEVYVSPHVITALAG